MTADLKTVIHYARVSDEEQATEGKASIPDQLARQRARSVTNSWNVVDEIVIEGFSARFLTYLEFSTAALEGGFPDAMRMWSHWSKADFNILSCRDMSRLGREQSILSEFVIRTINAGAVVMPLDEGMLDATNYRFGSAFSGMGASQHIDNLIRYHEMGMITKASRGGKVGNKPPPFYIETHDPLTLKPVSVKPDRERYQRLFDDFVIAYCDERIAYDSLGIFLYEQFGHTDPKTNKPYTKYPFLRMLFNAATWGHMAYGRYRSRGQKYNAWGYWITGDEPPPEDVKFFPNIVEPIWTSPTLERVKSEFYHRHHNLVGRMSNRTPYMFSGLCTCELCGSGMAGTFNYQGRRYYRCGRRYGGRRSDCLNSEQIPEVEIIDWLTPYLDHWRAGTEILPPLLSVGVESHLASLDNEIEEIRRHIKWLYQQGGKAGSISDEILNEEIRADETRVAKLIAVRARDFSADSSAYQQTVDRAQALSALREMDISSFWAQESFVINQMLHRLLGRTRIAIAHRNTLRFVTPIS